MLAQWTATVVGLMNKYGISEEDVAKRCGLATKSVNMVLNGRWDAGDAEPRIRKAFQDLLVTAIMKRTDERLEAFRSKNANEGKEVKQMAAKEFLTDEQVEQEIERLRQSPLVALARREQRIRYKRRQFLYQLRDLEKKGAALMKAGIDMEVLNSLAELGDYDDPC